MVYLKQIEKAYNIVKQQDGSCSVTFGNNHFTLDKRVYDSDNNYRIEYELIHYGTLILRVVYDFTTNHLIVQNGKGFSSTDRNNINALLQQMEIYFTQASIRNECLMLNYMGERTNEIIVYMG